MTATMTTIPSKVLARFEAEQAAERDRERADALAELAKLDSETPAIVQPYDEAVVKATEAVSKARQKLKDAENAAIEAHSRRRGAAHPLDVRRDSLRSRLEGELQHPAIDEALKTLDAIHEDSQKQAAKADPSHGNATYADAVKRAAWRVDARRSLQDLQFVACDDVPGAVRKIMSTRP